LGQQVRSSRLGAFALRRCETVWLSRAILGEVSSAAVIIAADRSSEFLIEFSP
jgi:hypothetical protein